MDYNSNFCYDATNFLESNSFLLPAVPAAPVDAGGRMRAESGVASGHVSERAAPAGPGHDGRGRRSPGARRRAVRQRDGIGPQVPRRIQITGATQAGVTSRMVSAL